MKQGIYLTQKRVNLKSELGGDFNYQNLLVELKYLMSTVQITLSHQVFAFPQYSLLYSLLHFWSNLFSFFIITIVFYCIQLSTPNYYYYYCYYYYEHFIYYWAKSSIKVNKNQVPKKYFKTQVKSYSYSISKGVLRTSLNF